MGGNSQSRQARALNGAPALRNSPVGCFNHRGFAAAKRIHHRTGRHAPNPKGRPDCSIAKSTCTGVCNDLLPLATLSRRGAQCAPRQRKIIWFVGEHSDSLRAAYGGCSLDAHCGGCVRPYGSAGADEFTNGVPRSYPRAPSLAALPQFTLAHPTG